MDENCFGKYSRYIIMTTYFHNKTYNSIISEGALFNANRRPD